MGCIKSSYVFRYLFSELGLVRDGRRYYFCAASVVRLCRFGACSIWRVRFYLHTNGQNLPFWRLCKRVQILKNSNNLNGGQIWIKKNNYDNFKRWNTYFSVLFELRWWKFFKSFKWHLRRLLIRYMSQFVSEHWNYILIIFVRMWSLV